MRAKFFFFFSLKINRIFGLSLFVCQVEMNSDENPVCAFCTLLEV